MPTPPSALKLAPASQTACYSPWPKVRVAIPAALTMPWSPEDWSGHALFGRLVRLGLASAGAAARWMAAVEQLAASGQFAFTLNYHAVRGVKP